MQEILEAADTVSDTFLGTGGPICAVISGVSGTTWAIEVETGASGTWVTQHVDGADTDAAGAWWFDSIANASYRITPSAAGPRAWIAAPFGREITTL